MSDIIGAIILLAVAVGSLIAVPITLVIKEHLTK